MLFQPTLAAAYLAHAKSGPYPRLQIPHLRGEIYFSALIRLAGRVVNWFTALVTGSEIPPACSDDTL
jgi:hypothetical protein